MEPDLLLTGERAALGPLCADLAATAARWSNDPERPHLSSRDSRRSLRTRSSVCSCGQYVIT